MTDEEAKLRKLLERAMDLLANCDVTSGCCCCGDSMASHAESSVAGHSPVDQGAYVAGQLHDDIRAALEPVEPAKAA